MYNLVREERLETFNKIKICDIRIVEKSYFLNTRFAQTSLTRRAIKATFVLIPLFGLQLFVVIYRPSLTSTAGQVYEIVAAAVVNTQVSSVKVKTGHSHRSAASITQIRAGDIHESVKA